MRVHCTLPNASNEISGVKFEAHPEGGVVSEDIPEEQAQAFASIPGYAIVGAPAVVTGNAGAAPAGKSQAELDAEAAAAAEAQAAEARAAEARAAEEAAAQELAQLRARGAELKIPHAEQMGAKRLKGEIAEAEKKLADAGHTQA